MLHFGPILAPGISDQCRLELAQTRGTGGSGGTLSKEKARAGGNVLNVSDDLLGFTGLSRQDMMKRLGREGVHHFDSEHAFWHPGNSEELRWFYISSVTYLFANAVHKPHDQLLGTFTPESGPVLDFSGGAGNNVITLAEQGIACAYTGIGLLEYNFARYRIRRRKLEGLVEFIEPYSNFQLDPLSALLPPRQYGCILAFDVLEHIPQYETTVRAMVIAVRPGGCICESSPFEQKKQAKGRVDTRIHVGNGGVSMHEAMGESMSKKGLCWWKEGRAEPRT